MQAICLQLYAFQNRTGDVIAHLQLPHLFTQRASEGCQYLLFPANVVAATDCKLKQIPAVETIKRVRHRQNHYVCKKPSQSEEIFVGLELEGFRYKSDLGKNLTPVSHATGAEKTSSHAKDFCFPEGVEPKTCEFPR